MNIAPVVEGLKRCKFCKTNTHLGVSFQGAGFRYLQHKEQACLECYIDHCVEQALIKALDMKEAPGDEGGVKSGEAVMTRADAQMKDLGLAPIANVITIGKKGDF